MGQVMVCVYVCVYKKAMSMIWVCKHLQATGVPVLLTEIILNLYNFLLIRSGNQKSSV